MGGGFGDIRARLARLLQLVGDPEPDPIDPRLAKAFLMAVPDCGCKYGEPCTCGRAFDPFDGPDPDADWLRPAWEAYYAMEAMIEAETSCRSERGDDDDDDA